MNVERDATAKAVATYFVYFFSIFIFGFSLTGSINRPRRQRRLSELILRERPKACNPFFNQKIPKFQR